MIHPIPPGTRDVLPDEMRELRASQPPADRGLRRGRLRRGRDAGDRIRRGALARRPRLAAASPYRFFDENGDLLALRSDMTVPIARLVATRFADAPMPLRLCYLASAYRAVHPAARRDARIRPGRDRADRRPGRRGHRRGDRRARGGARRGGPRPRRDRPRRRRPLPQPAGRVRGRRGGARRRPRPARHPRPGRARGGARPRPGSATRRPRPASRSRSCAAAPRCSSAPARSAATRSSAPPPACSETYETLVERGTADRVQIDFGLLRDLGYYTGAIFEVYDPALGHVLGGGGRYDGFLAKFGLDLPAAGFSLYLERVHVAQMEEESRRAERAAS